MTYKYTNRPSENYKCSIFTLWIRNPKNLLLHSTLGHRDVPSWRSVLLSIIIILRVVIYFLLVLNVFYNQRITRMQNSPAKYFTSKIRRIWLWFDLHCGYTFLTQKHKCLPPKLIRTLGFRYYYKLIDTGTAQCICANFPRDADKDLNVANGYQSYWPYLKGLR